MQWSGDMAESFFCQLKSESEDEDPWGGGSLEHAQLVRHAWNTPGLPGLPAVLVLKWSKSDLPHHVTEARMMVIRMTSSN